MNQELLLILKELKYKTKANQLKMFPTGLCLEFQKAKNRYCIGIQCGNCILNRFNTYIEHTLEKLNE